MGQNIGYRRLRTFSEDDTEKDHRSTCRRWRWMSSWRNILFAVIAVILLLSSFCAFYFWQVYSAQQAECQKKLKNQTTQAQVAAESLQIGPEALKKGCDEVKKDNNDLRVQLGTANQSLNKTHRHWDACQKELNTLHDIIRTQTKQQETEKHELQVCQAQLQNQTAQAQTQAALKKSTEALKKDLEKAQKAGDDLRAQLVTANQNLDKTHQHWDACQKELNTLHDIIRTQTKQQETEKHKLQEQITSLQQRLRDQLQEISKMENEMELEPSKSKGAIICGLVIIFLLPLFALLLV